MTKRWGDLSQRPVRMSEKGEKMKLPFKVDLTDKVAAITGAGGVICSEFARVLAECGAKVALLDTNKERASEYAAEIGKNATAIKCDCLDKKEIEEAKKIIGEKWGKVNLLINGAGGNNPKATCDDETMTPGLENAKDFFALEESGLKFVFDINENGNGVTKRYDIGQS